MKKILLLLATVLTSVGAWAQPKVSDAPVNGEWAENTTWYTMKNGHGNYISNQHVDDNGNLKWNSKEYTNNDRRAHWCIVGNETDGYLFYNKEVGASKALVTTGDEAAARTNFTEVAAATKFYLAESKKAGYWCVRIDKDGNNYWNARDGYVALWNSTDAVNGWGGSGKGDDGSAIMFEIAIDPDDLTELTYVLTDELGTTYTGTYKGVAGVSDPVLEGVAAYTLSDKKWNGNTFTATITFPFPVSSATVTNATMICSFANSNFKWYATGSSIKTCKDTPATNSNVLAHMWAFYPSFSNNAFVFTIKNLFTNTYVYSTSEENNHGEGAVTLSETASEFTVDANNRLKLSTGKYLSCNSTTTAGEQFIGTWDGHNGTNNSFPAVSYTVTVDASGYASLYSPVAVTLPENVTVYAVTFVMSSKAALTSMSDLPANQGAIVAAEEGTYTFTAGEATSDWTANLLKGTSVNTYVEGDAYVLSNKNGIGLYKADLNKNAAGETGKTHFLNNAGKAYLPASAVTGNARFISFDFGTETAIDELKGENGNVKTVIYDLAGRRVQGAQKGIFIVNGKKVIK